MLGISFQLFADGSARDREDDDNYLGLSHDYFSNDLKFLLNRIRDGEQEMPEELLDYICSTWEAANPSGEKHRIDLVHPSDREAFGRQVHEILHVKNAPLGKWPSRFSPAFMQQTAINLAIKKGKTPLFQENGEVFSVNGPPGTGKTTLLKEIIVSNIVERSALLAQYEDPEEAKAYLQTHLPEIRQAANTALKQAGSSLEAAVTLVKEAFPQRIYDTFRLPAGVYETLRITIGQGEGKNWWCVLFPTLCVPASSAGFEAAAVSAGMPEDLSHTLSGQTPDIRFRLLDWLGEIKCWLNG